MGTFIFYKRQFESQFSSEHCVVATFFIKIRTWRPTGMGCNIQFYIEIYIYIGGKVDAK